MKMGFHGLELVKHFESLHLRAYICPAGVPTIGWGHTGSIDGTPVALGQVITGERADQLLASDMERAEKAVSRFVSAPLAQHEFDALVSFTFNCGAGALQRSTLRKVLNQGAFEAVAEQLRRWNKEGGKVSAGLVRRREAEAYLFMTGELKFHF